MSELLSSFLLPGVVIGITAAFTPGTLMALLVSETMRSGVKAGVKVAISPLFTDIPFIIIAIIISSAIESSPVFLGSISFVGATFLTYLALQNFTVKQEQFHVEQSAKGSLLKGITVNLLNPAMYLWWFSVATPFFVRGNTIGSVIFAAALLLCSVGTMIVIVFGVSKARLHFLDYAHWILKALGVALLFFAWKLLQQGLSFL